MSNKTKKKKGMHVATHACSHRMQVMWKHTKVVKQFPDNSNVTPNTQTAKN